MEPHNSVPRGPTACTACATSKAKCLFAPDAPATNRKCIRCNRLNKHCVMQTATPRSRRPKGITRVAQLEEKLESLVSQLGTSQQPSSTQNDGNLLSIQSPYEESLFPEKASGRTSSSQYESSPASHQVSSHYAGSPPSHQRYSQFAGSPQSTQLPQTPVSSTQSEQPTRGLDLRNPDSLLAFYRDGIADQFPFVVIPRETKAFELNHDKPFLFKNIIMVASAQDVKAQTRMAEEILEYLSLHMLLRAEKNLDLLQGLLIFIAWFHCHVHTGRRLNVLLGLAEALVMDLKLSREPLVGLKREAKEQEYWAFPEQILGSETRTLDERRAYLGFVYLTSLIPLFMDSMEQPRHNPYIQTCVNIIQQSPEYLSDQHLLQLMKLQAIAQETNEVFPQDSLQFSPISSSSALYIKTLQTKLSAFEDSVPIHLKTNPFLLMHYHSILVYLTATALYIPSLPSRQAILHACLTSIISFFSALFSVPTPQYFKFSYPSWLQVNHGLTTLSKLSLFKSEDWDLSHVGEIMDLSLVLDGVLRRFEELALFRRRMSGHDTSGDGDLEKDGVLGKSIPRIREQKAAFERRRAEIMQKGDQGAFTVPQMTFSGPIEPQMQLMAAPTMSEQAYDSLMPFQHFDLPPVNFSQLDDAFWQEFVGEYSTI